MENQEAKNEALIGGSVLNAGLCVGDLWVFTTNNGTIPRKITAVGSKQIAYLDARGKKRDCQIATFARWQKGAELEFRYWGDA